MDKIFFLGSRDCPGTYEIQAKDKKVETTGLRGDDGKG